MEPNRQNSPVGRCLIAEFICICHIPPSSIGASPLPASDFITSLFFLLLLLLLLHLLFGTRAELSSLLGPAPPSLFPLPNLPPYLKTLYKPLVRSLKDFLIVAIACFYAHQAVDRAVDRTVDWAVNRSVGRSVGLSVVNVYDVFLRSVPKSRTAD